MQEEQRDGLTVAVTGPTGEIGRAVMKALEASDQVASVTGMARRPFDPAAQGWTKTQYVQGDVLDRAAVEVLVKDADVVVHLAFAIFGGDDEGRRVNIEGSCNVFEAAATAGCRRLVYTSSVAAYGFHDDNPVPLTEDIEARGTDEHYYSAHKAEVEKLLWNVTSPGDLDVYVFRPCIVAGPSATALIENIPFVQIGERLPGTVRKALGAVPLLRPVIPDPGIPFQLVHEDDVATAVIEAIVGNGPPGVYNLAGDGDITTSDLARALGWYAISIPEIAVEATVSIVSRMPLMPTKASWLNALRVPVLMDCSKAKEELGWTPRYDALDTLATVVQGGAVSKGLLGG